jgi:hypothetical protein
VDVYKGKQLFPKGEQLFPDLNASEAIERFFFTLMAGKITDWVERFYTKQYEYTHEREFESGSINAGAAEKRPLYLWDSR